MNSRIDNWVGDRSLGASCGVETRTELPMDAVKEAIVNAVCHRDYASNSSGQVMLFKDRLEIRNPGALPFGLTLEQLSCPQNSYPANPLLAEAMYYAGYIEKLGTGTEAMTQMCREWGCQEPMFSHDNEFVVTFYRESQEEVSQQ